MDFKQFLIQKLMLFFTLSTLIGAAMYVLGAILDPNARFGYDVLLSPLIYAGACVLPSLVRELIQFILTEAIVLGLAFSSSAIDTSRPDILFGIVGSVLVIYLLVFLLSWLVNSAQAKQVNEELLAFQRLHGVDLCTLDRQGNPDVGEE